MHMNTVRPVAMPPLWDMGQKSSARQGAQVAALPGCTIPSPAQFHALRASYRQTGGVARGDDLARLLEDRQRGGHVSLAKVLVAREVFGFRWREEIWVPMFQFELRDLSIKFVHRPVLAELAPVFDNWSLAVWFTQPNAWLCDRSPLDVLESNLSAVLDAARADRFIANG